MATQTTPELQSLSVAFPFRAADGKALVDEHAFYEWLSGETTGNFAISSAGMWHGGIHVSANSAGRQLDLAHGVRCIATGEIVAYRLNQAALASQVSAGQTGHYSSAFTLVRHTLEYPADNRLAFFSLYMHLQSVAEYSQKTMPAPTYWARCHEVTQHAADKPKATAHTPIPPGHIGLNIRADAKGSSEILGILPRGTQVRIGEKRNKGLWGKIESVESGTIVPASVGGTIRQGAEKGWVYLGKERGHLVLSSVISQAQSDRVIVPETPIRINAGDLIGHLGQYWLPDNPVQDHQMVHIEVFCGSDLPGFLAKTRTAAKNVADFNKLPLLRIDKGVKLFQVKKTNAQGQPVYEEGANAPQTAVVQIYSQAVLDALPADYKGPKDNGTDQGQPWWYVTSANSRHEDIRGWVRNRQMPPTGGVTRESPHAWTDFETVTGADAGNPTIFSTVDAYLDHILCEDKPATGSLDKLKPLACNAYQALSPMRNEARAADEMRALKGNKWLRLRASRLIPKHRSEWASQSEYQSFFDKVLQRIKKEPYHDAEIERLKTLVWWDDVKTAVKGPFPDSPDVFHIHPIALVGNFLATRQSECECGCCYAKKFKVVRLGSVYGPIYWGTRSLDSSVVLEELMQKNEISVSERRILIAMSENEGKLDAVQSYDSEIVTAGAMQKTINQTGAGELPTQVALFRNTEESAYHELFEKCGWSVEGDGSEAKMFYSHPDLTGGNKITGSSLKSLIRVGCSSETYQKFISSIPLSVIVNALNDKRYERRQLMDFLVRLRDEILPKKPIGYGYPIGAYFMSDLGRATALDQHVNRPGYVRRDIGYSLSRFFASHPGVSTNPEDWGGNRASYERIIIEDYGNSRSMAVVQGVSVAPGRYQSIKNKLN